MHAMLGRLDDVASHLAKREDVVAVLGLGSAGVEHDRMDEHSDLDFFVIVDDALAKADYLSNVDWLGAAHPLAYSFVNDPNGRKALFADGIFAEYAVFTIEELSRLSFRGARVVWQRDDAPDGLAGSGLPPTGPPFDTVEFHLNEALTNLYVGLHRELRGERLTAFRFIQCFAVDRVIALLNLTVPVGHRRDPYEASRRVEQGYPPEVLPLNEMVRGYEGNRAAARFTFDWLRRRFAVDPAIANAIEQLLAG